MREKNNQITQSSIWRVVSRWGTIQECAEGLAKLLRSRTPLGALAVYRVNRDSGEFDAVAEVAVRGNLDLPSGRNRCDFKKVKSAFRSAKRLLLRGRNLPLPAMGCDAWFGLLMADEEIGGMVGIGVREGTEFSELHLHQLEMLLEPMGAALENDQRYHDLMQQREAAEAERNALLQKLGRHDLSPTVVGIESGLRGVLEQVRRVARSTLPVLLLGETGSGKEVIARAVHTQSGRKSGPFLRVNCGAIPQDLVDSQLFGHEKGSFTGATDTRKGWFERADGGTLVLDEIGDLPLAAQVRLLRVLEDGSLERVGSQHPLHVDVRVVGATHRDLAEMVARREFRADLWHRLAVFPIPIPALRERLADIAPLAQHFAEKAATRFGLPLCRPSESDIRLLKTYAWPGNVRELAAVIDRAALLGNGRRLEVETALGGQPALTAAAAGVTSGDGKSPPAREVSAEAMPAAEAMMPAGAGEVAWSETGLQGSSALPNVRTLDDAMRAHIIEALRACHGRVQGPFGAARRLKIEPNTLRGRMRKLGIEPRKYRGSM